MKTALLWLLICIQAWGQEPEGSATDSSSIAQPETKKALPAAKKPKAKPAKKMPKFVLNKENRQEFLAQKKWIEQYIDRYVRYADKIVIGEIVDQRNLLSGNGKDKQIEVKVIEWLRGKGKKRERYVVPFNAPFIPDRPETVPAVVVESYKMLMFVNKYGSIIDGNAMFVVEGPYAFRNKRPNVFINPRHDREWEMSFPLDDYIMYELGPLREKVKSDNQRGWLRRLFR